MAFPLVMAGSFFIVARAVVVPSHPVRTLWVSLATTLPIAVGAHLYNTALPPGVMPPHPLVPSLAEIIWLMLGVALAVMTSGVTYGLREAGARGPPLGHYTLEERIGIGGMGEVHRARHARLRRPVAVKLLPREHSSGTSADRFEREAQLTALLTHPNTVAIYDLRAHRGRRLLLRDGAARRGRPRRAGAGGGRPAPGASGLTSSARSAAPWPRPTSSASSTGTSSRPT